MKRFVVFVIFTFFSFTLIVVNCSITNFKHIYKKNEKENKVGL